MGRHGSPHAELSPAAAERAALCELLIEVGQDAPTLCDGWSARELAAHLVVRENRPDALPGYLIPALHGYSARLEQATGETVPFADLVARLRSGPPFWSPLGLPIIKDRGNLHEFFIHHEDVRRAAPGWQVRRLPPETNAELWNLVRTFAPFLLRGMKDTRVTLHTPEGGERAVGRAQATHQVTLTGPAGELLLYMSGRRSAAEVQLGGSPAGQARLAAANLGM